jgi:hypothetical protein
MHNRQSALAIKAGLKLRLGKGGRQSRSAVKANPIGHPKEEITGLFFFCVIFAAFSRAFFALISSHFRLVSSYFRLVFALFNHCFFVL